MSCCGPVVIGASCDDQIDYGETIDLIFTYQNEDGTPIDLSSTVVDVFSSNPSIIQAAAVVTVSDAVNGKVRFLLHADDALQLKRSANNRFRLRAVFGPDSDDVTPDIFLQVS